MAASILLVVDNPARWPLKVEGVEVVAAQQYLTDPTYNNLRHARLFNLCSSYSYKSAGYYVSLLAEARGHRPQPDVITIQDMKSASLVRAIADELDRLVQRALRPIRSDQFQLSVYFGKTLAKRDQQLGLRLFGLLRSPLMRAQFVRKRHKWLLQGVRPIPAEEIPESHHSAVIAAAKDYFARRQWSSGPSRSPRYHLGILIDPEEEQPPSDGPAIEKFMRAADRLGVSAELITRDDFGRVGVFDALFIRTTTFVNHYTYRFARRAAAEGLAVIDDPVSIARCTNKVYLAERLAEKVPIPPTLLVHKGNAQRVLDQIGLPCVLKQPDSAFSRGVIKIETHEQFHEKLPQLLDESDLIVAQPFVPTQFDWRVGVLDGQPLYVCKYYMARHHWQILHRDPLGRIVAGRAETLPVEQAPHAVVAAAVKAARLIGDGLYGVDLKQIGRRIYVIEVNDNPSIEAGVEDAVLKDQLYNRIIQSLIHRVDQIRNAHTNGFRKRTQKEESETASAT
ncbi:MAG TPA: RimK family protein [Phycisphaeraceae bacterium]